MYGHEVGDDKEYNLRLLLLVGQVVTMSREQKILMTVVHEALQVAQGLKLPIQLSFILRYIKSVYKIRLVSW